MFKKVQEVIEGSGKDNWAVPVEKVEDGTGKAKVGGLNYLCASELEDGVDGENNLEQGKGFGNGMVLEDVLASYSKKGNKFGSIRKEVGSVKGSMRKGGWDVGVLDCSEVSEPPEIKSRVGEWRIWEGKVPRGRMKGIGSGSAHCGARSKREGGNSSEDLLKSQMSSLCNRCRGLDPQRRVGL